MFPRLGRKPYSKKFQIPTLMINDQIWEKLYLKAAGLIGSSSFGNHWAARIPSNTDVAQKGVLGCIVYLRYPFSPLAGATNKLEAIIVNEVGAYDANRGKENVR